MVTLPASRVSTRPFGSLIFSGKPLKVLTNVMVTSPLWNRLVVARLVLGDVEYE